MDKNKPQKIKRHSYLFFVFHRKSIKKKVSSTCLEQSEGKKMMTDISFVDELCSYLFLLGCTEIIDGRCKKHRCHTGFKAEGRRSPVGSVGRWCVMVVLVPLCPLSAALRAQLLRHAASICLQRWEATHISTANQSHLELSPNFSAQHMP